MALRRAAHSISEPGNTPSLHLILVEYCSPQGHSGARAVRQPALANRSDFDTRAAGKIAKLVPLGRWQGPEDVAAMAVFLASPRAANITGQAVNVDGGYVMRG